MSEAQMEDIWKRLSLCRHPRRKEYIGSQMRRVLCKVNKLMMNTTSQGKKENPEQIHSMNACISQGHLPPPAPVM
jgi:hypothetical protein